MTTNRDFLGDPTQGLPAGELDDEELERQGLRAHATRHWVFLHGTAEQFRTHTQRMLELEDEYLRRHPQRTWQGSGGTEPQAPSIAAAIRRIRDLVDLVQSELSQLATSASPFDSPQPSSVNTLSDESLVWAKMLARFSESPGGRLHKLEVHQIARQVAPNARLVAALYRNDPPLLAVDGDYRVLTDAGRRWLADHPLQ